MIPDPPESKSRPCPYQARSGVRKLGARRASLAETKYIKAIHADGDDGTRSLSSVRISPIWRLDTGRENARRTLDCEKDKMGTGPRDCSTSGSVGGGPIWVRCFTRCYKIANMGTKIRIRPRVLVCLSFFSLILVPQPRKPCPCPPSFCPPSPSSPSLPTNLRLLSNAGSAHDQGEEGWRGLCVYLTFSLPSCH